MTDAADDFIAHFGKKGMKWGVITEPDSYHDVKKPGSEPSVTKPSGASGGGESTGKKTKEVSPEKLEKREKKATEFEGNATKLREVKAEREKQLEGLHKADILTRSNLKTEIKQLDKMAITADKDAVAVREGRLTSNQKNLIIGAAVVGGLMAAYGTNRMVQSGGFTSMATRGRAYKNGNPESLFKRKESLANKNYSADDIMKHVVPGVNPRYGDWGTNMNCRRATFAYEMRRRGMDVQATRTSNASGQTVLGVISATGEKMRFTKRIETMQRDYQGGLAKNQLSRYSDDIFASLSKQPEGSRGEFGVMWKSAVPGIPGGGHSMAYEIIKGKAHIFDAQVGKEYKEDDPIFSSVMSAGFTRLDNQKLNEKFLSKWVR